MRSVFNKKTLRELPVDILYFFCGAVLYSCGVYSFAVAGDFAPGGVSGLSIIVNHFFSFIPIGMCSLVINIPVIIFTYVTLGKKFLFKSVISMVIVAIVLDFVFPYLPTYNGDPLLAALFAGCFSGIGLALIYMRGSSTGGTDFIILALKKKKPHISIGTITLMIDGSVLILNGFAFGRIEAVLYGAILTYVSSIFIDKIMYSIESRKKISIISTKGEEIGQRINALTGNGATLVKAIGTYSKKDLQMLIYLGTSSQVSMIKSVAMEIDENSWIFIDTADEIYKKLPEDE